MKIRIISEPGELESKADDAIRVIERLVGRELTKSKSAPNQQIKQTAAQFEYAAIKGSFGSAKTHAQRIARLMSQKMAEVIGG